jgi:uncharacterized protein (DUF2141 family)
MKKITGFLFLSLSLSVYCFSQAANNRLITVEITNVVINGGTVYLAIFSNAESFKNENPEISFELEANNTILQKEVSLPNGNYVISAYQDTNNNKRLDYGLFGIPKESIAISNYFGKGFPSNNFDKQKVLINNTTGKVTIGLYRL